MKKSILSILVFVLLLSLIGCSTQEEISEDLTDFKMAGMNSGLGGRGDTLDESSYSYTIYLQSAKKDIKDIKAVKINPGDLIKNRIIEENNPEIKLLTDNLEIQGEIIFNTKGMTKEQILALEPYISSLTVLLNDNTESSVPLNNK